MDRKRVSHGVNTMRLKLLVLTAYADIIGVIIPRRASEEIVRRLTFEKLQTIARRSLEALYAPAIRLLLPYRHPAVKALIYELKYRRNPIALRLAAMLLGEELLGASEESIGRPLLIPVPMHADRKRARGYNQTELVCEALLSQEDIPLAYAPHGLIRARSGTPQQKLARGERLKNMRGSMRADPRAVGGRVCVVVDDVSTTGATLLECKRALMAGGAKEVHLVALAG